MISILVENFEIVAKLVRFVKYIKLTAFSISNHKGMITIPREKFLPQYKKI